MKRYVFYFENISMIPFCNGVKQGEKIITFFPSTAHASASTPASAPASASAPSPKTKPIVNSNGNGNVVLGGGFTKEEINMDIKQINSYVKKLGWSADEKKKLKLEHRRKQNRARGSGCSRRR